MTRPGSEQGGWPGCSERLCDLGAQPGLDWLSLSSRQASAPSLPGCSPAALRWWVNLSGAREGGER